MSNILCLVMVLFNFYYQCYSSREPVKLKKNYLDSLIITFLYKRLSQKNSKIMLQRKKYLQMIQQITHAFILKFLNFNDSKINYSTLECAVSCDQGFDYHSRRQKDGKQPGEKTAEVICHKIHTIATTTKHHCTQRRTTSIWKTQHSKCW